MKDHVFTKTFSIWHFIYSHFVLQCKSHKCRAGFILNNLAETNITIIIWKLDIQMQSLDLLLKWYKILTVFRADLCSLHKIRYIHGYTQKKRIQNLLYQYVWYGIYVTDKEKNIIKIGKPYSNKFHWSNSVLYKLCFVYWIKMKQVFFSVLDK